MGPDRTGADRQPAGVPGPQGENRMNAPRRTSLGFTLVEILIAMVLMALLMGAAALAMEAAHDSNVYNAEKTDLVLMAVGRRPVTEDLGLEENGVELENGFIRIDEWCRTTAEGVYAIGDVAGEPMLAHVGSHEGIVAAEHIAGQARHPMRYDNIPSVGYCHPEIASIGLTEAKAVEAGYEVKAGKYPLNSHGRALTAGANEGFVKVVADAKYGELLGVHMIGHNVSELIAELAAREIPVFGICLGHQLISLGFGAETFKLLYGHRGGNHPVHNRATQRVEITSQNHGFAVRADGDSVPGAPDLVATHLNLNDGTLEGVRHRELPILAVQYHPESAPGPHDSRYLFDDFLALMEIRAK